MKTKHIVSALVSLAAIAVAASSSASSYYFEHGIDCKPAYGQAGQAGYGEPGIGNFSSGSSLRVFCSPGQTIPSGAATPTFTGLGVYVSDNNASSPFSCYPYAASSTWGTYWGATKYSCSQYGGCPDSTSSYTGTANMSWTNPFSITSLWSGTFDVGVSCTIPPSSTYASWIQHVALVGT